eukprot:COSAG02_NODE_1774_length_10973_cov_18.317914_8_plen_37_part_00
MLKWTFNGPEDEIDPAPRVHNRRPEATNGAEAKYFK